MSDNETAEYIPAGISLKKSSKVTSPMSTRVVTSEDGNVDDKDDNDNSEEYKEELPAFNILAPDELLRVVCKLPSLASELAIPDNVEFVSVNEVQSLLKALGVTFNPSNYNNIIKNKATRRFNNREKGNQRKYEMLKQLGKHFGNYWTVIHENAEQRSEFPSKLAKKKKDQVIPLNYGLQYSPYRSDISSALSLLHQRERMPSRNEFLFLSDEEYENAKIYFKTIHPDTLKTNNDSSSHEILTLEYLLGKIKETSDAIDDFYNAAYTASAFIERIKQSEASKNAKRLAGVYTIPAMQRDLETDDVESPPPVLSD